MLGAVLGDIIGSRFEFDRGGKTKIFRLFTEENSFTDDSVMTAGVAEGLLNAGKNAEEKEIKKSLIKSMQKTTHFCLDSTPAPLARSQAGVLRGRKG